MEQIYTPELIGELNQKRILTVIREEGPLSRADICRRVSLSFPAVSANVKVLLERDLLRAQGAGNNAVGRKSVLLGFNADYGYLAALRLGRRDATEMLCNLDGEPLDIRTADIGQQFTDLRQIQEHIVSLSGALLEESGIPREKVLCVSVSLPGAMDSDTGEFYMVPYLPQIRRDALVSAIQEVFGGVPVLFENNVNNGALGEQWRGAGKGFQDIFYFHYDIGMGGALILNNELYKGSHRAAGEIGYMLLGAGALRSKFLAEGAAEKLLSGHAILSMLQESGLAESLEAWFDACDSGSRRALEALRPLVEGVGILLVNVTSALDPQIIILAGSIGRRIFRHARAEWVKMLGTHVPYVPQIVCSEMEGTESLYGAVKVGLAYLSGRNFQIE